MRGRGEGTMRGPCSAGALAATGASASALQPGWSVIVPYFNEEKFLEPTLRALLMQEVRPLTLILVDNSSTDSSTAIAQSLTAHVRERTILHLTEARPGKTWALMAGLAAVTSEYVAICDADTFYPPDYLAKAEKVFTRPAQPAAALAWGLSGDPESTINRLLRAKGMAAAALMPRQCHSGGFGQSFRTAALRDAGGFSAERWPFVLEDHEVMHCLTRAGGRPGYAFDLWCRPSGRRADRKKVDWTLLERVMYHLTPFAQKDWLFYRFLAPRFTARGMKAVALRDRTWETSPAPPSSRIPE